MESEIWYSTKITAGEHHVEKNTKKKGRYTVRFLMDDTVKTAEDVEKIIGVMPLTVILEYQDKDKKKQGRHRRK